MLHAENKALTDASGLLILQGYKMPWVTSWPNLTTLTQKDPHPNPTLDRPVIFRKRTGNLRVPFEQGSLQHEARSPSACPVLL